MHSPPMKVFLAGPGSKRDILGQLIREELPKHGIEAFDWTSGPGWDNPAAYDPREVARMDLAAVANSEALIWYADGTPSHGDPFEAGWAIGVGMPVIIWYVDGNRSDPSLHHLIYFHLNRQDGDIELAYSFEEAVIRALIAVKKNREWGMARDLP